MEGAPRPALLRFQLKHSPDAPHFAPKLKQYILEAYREDPDTYSNELNQLEGLRSTAVHPTRDTSGLAAQYRYFCQLRSLQSRFPMAKGQPAAVAFTWKDIYGNMSCSLPDIRFEMACVLYNIGALNTQIGAAEDRTSSEGLKAACTHYQTAAWAFQQLREQYPQPPGVDLSCEVLRLLQEMCFAQAQECILEKSIQDTKKPSVVGAVATQVLIFYRNSLTLLGSTKDSDTIIDIIGTKIYHQLNRYIGFKVAYVSSIVCLYQGMNAEEQQKMGERVAYYQMAVEKLAEARKLVKYIEPKEVTEEVMSFMNDVVEGKRKAAKNENEFIYHEEVPDKDLLTDLKPVCLVKPMAVNFNDPDVSGTDIFARLVPMNAHEASSMYSEEKAQLLRHVVSMAEKKNAELVEFMSSLQLDQLEALDSQESIPQELVDRCAAMNAKTEVIQMLVDSMNNLAEIISDVEHSLAEVKELIREETDQEKEYQKAMGPRPPSIVQTELSREANKYSEAHLRTGESNQVLHKAMTLHLANLRLLASPLDKLQAKIPSVSKIDGLDSSTMKEMKRIVGKVKEMQKQRDMLLNQLREAINADDITAQLLARSEEPLNEIFKKEIEKHSPQVKIIEQNLAAQENIINKLTSVYASYGESRRLLTDVMRKRDALINALITSYDTHEDLLAKSQKGLEFYGKLSSNVGHLLTRLRSTCQVQREERHQLLAKLPGKSTAALKNVEPAAAPTVESSGPKLKDYLPYMKNHTAAKSIAPIPSEKLSSEGIYPDSMYPTFARPAPLGSEASTDPPQIKMDGYASPSIQSNDPSMYGAHYNYGERSPYANPTSISGYQAYPNTNKTAIPYDYQQPTKSIYSNQSVDNENINYNNYSTNYTPGQFPAQSMNNTNNYYSPYYTASQDMNTNVTNSENSAQYNADNIQANTSASGGQYTYSVQESVYPNQQNCIPPVPGQQYGMSAEGASDSPNYTNNAPTVQGEFNANFSQMQISVTKQEGIANSVYSDPSYSQTYFSAYYPNMNAPNVATYSNAAQPTQMNVSGSQSQPEYNSLNYPYAVDPSAAPNTSSYQASMLGPSTSMNPARYDTSSPALQYSQYGQQVIQENTMQPTFNSAMNPMGTVPLFDSANASISHADSGSMNNIGMFPTDEKIVSSAAMSGFTALDEPIKSHVTGRAITSDTSLMKQIYQSGFDETMNGITSVSNYGQPVGVDQTDVPSTSYVNNYDQTPGSVGQSYQSHPGYCYNTSTGNYDYTYGYQSTSVDYNFQNQGVVNSQQPNEQCIPQNIYTNAGTYETIQSPSEVIEQPAFPTNETNNQSYYNTPYGYQTNANASSSANVPKSSEQAGTNYGADTNQSTYMNSGKSNNNTTPTYSNNQERPKQNITPDTSMVAPLPPQKAVSPKAESKPSEQSTMDLLSGLDFTVEYKPLMPEIKVPPVSEHVIRKPPVQTKMEQPIIKEQKLEEDTIERPAKRDIFSDASLLNKFTQEVKNLHKLVDGLTNKMQSGITVLDNKWKILHDVQAKENMRRSKSAAIENAGSNVVSDVVPFDDSRLTLKTNPEVYINASYYKKLAPWCIPLVISKLPEKREHNTFWTAVLENKISCVVCLLSEMELQGKCYWPTGKGQSLELENGLRVTLEEATTTVHWTERRLTLTSGKASHSIMHYQINVFPAKVVCGPLVLLVDRVLSATYNNRLSNQLGKAWVHCEHGAGRSALITLLMLVMCQVRAGQVNLCDMIDAGCLNLYKNRTNVLEDTKYLADAYRTTLFYVQGVLCSGTTNFNGEAVSVQSGASVQPPPINTTPQPKDSFPKFSKESFEEMKQTAGLKSGDMKDPLSFLDPLWSLKKK